ncbi:MAG: type II toxin-antitoxin system RelE/ParE family toxin [Magnetococcales bacterium]|nr:type II toxin-antitoxin system RelE/ParE family toxin [Magnetococcales bacterium]
MSRILKRPEAERDLDEIWWYSAQDNPQNTDRFLDGILEKCQTLADFPQLGVCRDEICIHLRSQTVGHYLIFYVPIENGIKIIRILHGLRDVEKLTFFQ